ncbi:hypothetical protein ACWJJH_02575 [Endozoicomonadaceae bacterium StTr2]
MMTYTVLKLIHLGSLVFWLGPALGSWLVLRHAQRSTGELSQTTSLVYRIFFLTVTLEHIAFATLLTSGVLLASLYNLFTLPWLQYKLAIVLLIVVPLEVVDIWLGNWKIKQLVTKRNAGATLTSRESACIRFYHTTFTYIALATIPASVLAIMWLAISKTVP